MDTPNISLNKSKAYKPEKLKFYNWVLKWACSDNLSPENAVPEDTSQIASILQAMGYKLESFERNPLNDQNPDENKDNEIKIEVQCRKSGMRAILTKQGTNCTCPNPEIADDAKIWTISGCGPSPSVDNLNKIEQTYSSLLPMLSKDNTQLVRDVIYKILSLISEIDINQNKNETNGNTSKSTFTRTKSLETIIKKPELKRQSTWEVDPKTSPPIKTSSPIPEMCKSLDQLSLQTDKEQMLADILHNVKENIDKALVLLPVKNDTFTKTNVKRVSNIKVSPTVLTPTRSTSGKSTPDLPRRNTPVKSTEAKKLTPKQPLIAERKFLGISGSKVNSIRKKTESITPTTSRAKFIKKDTPFPKLLTANYNSEDGKRPALSTFNKSSNLRGSNSNISSLSPNPSISKPKSNIPAFSFKAPASKTGIAQLKSKPK